LHFLHLEKAAMIGFLFFAARRTTNAQRKKHKNFLPALKRRCSRRNALERFFDAADDGFAVGAVLVRVAQSAPARALRLCAQAGRQRQLRSSHHPIGLLRLTCPRAALCEREKERK
jgi:hypothetical protein